ncbi:MAG: hypothetical protein RLZZ326_2822 [Planctomycetota bacterium]|jgi:hypothetical protein
MATAMLTGMLISMLAATLFAIRLGKTKDTPREHYIANRTLSIFQVSSLFISTSMALAGAIFSSIWLGYSVGLSSLLLQLLWLVGFMILSRFSETISRLSNNGTLHNAIAITFSADDRENMQQVDSISNPHPRKGETVHRLAAGVTVIGFTFLIGWEAVVAADMFSVISTSSDFLLAITLSLAACAAGYTAMAGISGNVIANRFQNALAYVAVIYILAFLVNIDQQLGGEAMRNAMSWDQWNPLSGRMLSLTIGAIASTFLTSLTWQLVDASAWQNIASHNKEQSGLGLSIWASALVVFVFGGAIPTFIGHFLSTTKGITADGIVPHLIQIFRNDAVGLVIVTAGFTGAMMSTADSFILACSETFCWDLLQTSQPNRNGSADKLEAPLRDVTHAGGSANDTTAPTATEETDRTQIAAGLKEELIRRRFTLSKWLGVACATAGSLIVSWLRSNGTDLYNIVWMVYLSQCILFPAVLLTLFSEHRQPTKQSFGVASISAGLAVGFLFGIACVFVEKSWITWTPIVGTLAAGTVLTYCLLAERVRTTS